MKYSNLEFDYDPTDYPDYCDAYIVNGEIDGRPMTPEEIDIINDDRQLVYDLLMEHLY